MDQTDANALSLSMKIKDSKSTQIQGEGNSIQYIFNEEIIENFNTCLLQLTEKIYDRPFVVNDSLSLSVINDINGKLQNHNKLIRVQQGGRLIENGYADDSDGDQKIRSAESRAIRRKFRGRGHPTPYSRPVQVPAGSHAQLSSGSFGS